MLRPAKMEGFRAIIPQSKRENALASLHEKGIAQFREVTIKDLEKEELVEEFYEINSVIGRLEEAKEFFHTEDLDTTIKVEDQSLDSLLGSAKDLLGEIEPKKDKLESELMEVRERKDDFFARKDTVQKLSDIDIPLGYLRSTGKVEIVVGQIGEEELEEFLSVIEEEVSGKVFAAKFGTGATRLVVLVCRKGFVSDLRPIQYRFGVESLEIPSSEKRPEEYLEYLDSEMEELKDEEENVREKIDSLKEKKAARINALLESLSIEQERQESLSFFGRTDATTVIEGWVPEDEVDSLEDTIDGGSDGAYIMRTYEPSESDIPETPIKLENPGFFDSYEYITEMYSLPRYDATDPTLLVAISFSIFFGFTLSDAGYGLILLVLFISGFSLIKNMFSKNLRYIMIAGSLGTIFAGALFGSWFGGELGEHFAVFEPLWTDPIYNPIPFLKLVIFFGIVHLAVGFAIAGGRKSILRRDWRNLILHNIGNTLLILGLFSLAFCVVKMGYELGIYFPSMGIFEAFNPFYSKGLVFKGMFYSGLIMSVLGQVTDPSKPLMSRFGGAIDTFYSIIGYISDVVSYSRLLALGIATSVIALVINRIGFMLYDIMSPATFSGPLSYLMAGVGLVGMAVVLIFGHAFNMFINSITGFVHTMRLHYAEFFQTFYEGGGEGYSPFKLIRKYT